MDEKRRASEILRILKKPYQSKPTTSLSYNNTVQLLVAVILSAQCTDARVNIVVRPLFKKYKTAKDFANADRKTFEKEIRSTGFYRNKAKNIINACKIIDEQYDGKVPKTMPELLHLPGVARKTANIVLSEGYGIIDGIAVDTHVTRLSNRLGFTKHKNPEKIEQDLMQLSPHKDWGEISLRLIWHGRAVCKARKPLCGSCPVNKLCPSAFSF